MNVTSPKSPGVVPLLALHVRLENATLNNFEEFSNSLHFINLGLDVPTRLAIVTSTGPGLFENSQPSLT